MGSMIDFPRLDMTLDSMFDRMHSVYNNGSRGQYHFVDGDTETTIYVSVPGYKSDDLNIEMHEGRLSITGQPSIERSLGVLVPKQISLRFTVHTSMLVESAELSDGLLAVRLTKQNKTEALRIPVQTK